MFENLALDEACHCAAAPPLGSEKFSKIKIPELHCCKAALRYKTMLGTVSFDRPYLS
jgi:hypothetical protein